MKQSGLCAALALWLPVALAAPQFVASEIPRANDNSRMHFADMDGDGRQDVLLPSWSEAQGRELHIYLQQPDGRYPSLPSRTVELRPEIIAFGTADLRAAAGDELVFVSSDAAYSFSSAIDSYAGNLKKLLDWPMIASMPERRDIAQLGALPDVDKDGHADLFLPDDEGFGYFRGLGAEEFALAGKVITVGGDLASVERRNRSGEAGIRANVSEDGELEISVTPATKSEFRGFLAEWRAELPPDAGLLRHQGWVPALSLAAIDDDALTDLVFINEPDNDEGLSRRDAQVSVLTQTATGTFAAQADWQATIEPGDNWRLVEFTGDTRVDLVRTADEASEPTAYFYRNKGGTFDLAQPDQVLRFSGLGLELDFSDLDNDGKPELGVSYFSIPILDALRNTTIQRSRLIFANVATVDTGPLFSRRADYKRDEDISADSVLGLTASGNFRVDLDGDNRKDYLQVEGNGTLTARTIGANLQIAETPSWQYVPNRIVTGFRTEELNGDGRPDLVLHHSLHYTVLVSAE